MLAYSMFGLTVKTGWTLSGVPRASDASRVDVVAKSGRLPPEYVGAPVLRTHTVQPGLADGPGGGYLLHVSEEPTRYRLEFPEGVRVAVADGGGRLWMVWPEGCEPSDVMHYLLYDVMPLALYLLGRTGLHGAALEVDGAAFALLGWSRVGKSSITAELAARSRCTVLTDDYIALTTRGGNVMANPGYPWIALRPEAPADVQAFEGCTPLRVGAPWAYFGDTFVTCSLEENDLAFGKSAVRLASAYLLERAPYSELSFAIEEVTLRDALVPTLGKAYFLEPARQRERTARTIRMVGRLLDQA